MTDVNSEMKPLPFKVEKWDLRNWFQLRDATESVAITLVIKGHGGFAPFLQNATNAFWVRPNAIDRRTTEGKRYIAAQEALLKAATEFDLARKALTETRDKAIAERG